MELVVAVGDECKMLGVACSHRQRAPVLALEGRDALLAVNGLSRIKSVEISHNRAFFVDVTAHEIVDVLTLGELAGRSRIHEMDSLVSKPSVPVGSSQHREFRRLNAFRKSIHKMVAVAAAPDVCHLKGELMVRARMHDSHESCLIYSNIIIEVTELPDLQGIEITLIAGESDELLTGHELEEIALVPFDVCIFYRRRKIVDRVRIAVFVE